MKTQPSASDTLKRVMRASLTMQRYNWEQGVLAQAFEEAGDAQTALLLAVEAAHRQNTDGRCAHIGASNAATDPCSVGEALIAACERTHDPFLDNARDGLLRWALEGAPRNAQGIVYHLVDAPQFWVDSMYMLPPFLARAGHIQESLRQLDGYWAALYDKGNGLLSHIWDDATRRFIRPAFWGVGNGWALAGLTRVIALLPPSHATHRERLIARLRSLLSAVLRYQLPDGRFHDVLNDPQSFIEVNCGQMTAYTIYRGVKAGWLDASYLPSAERSRAAAFAQVDAYGQIQGVCGAPSFNMPGVAVEGQAFFILMEAARRALNLS